MINCFFKCWTWIQGFSSGHSDKFHRNKGKHYHLEASDEVCDAIREEGEVLRHIAKANCCTICLEATEGHDDGSNNQTTIATIFIIPNQNSVSPKNLALSVFKAVKAKRITVSVSQTGTLGNQNWM